jgi:hypothetical protein
MSYTPGYLADDARYWRQEHENLEMENQRLRDAIFEARNLARDARYNDTKSGFANDLYEIERILEVV